MQQKFRSNYRFFEMMQYKKESLITNAIANKVIDNDKKRNIIFDKKLNPTANKAVKANEKKIPKLINN